MITIIFLVEIVMRFFSPNEYPLIILYAELILVGALLSFETITFIRLSKRIFEDDFEDEQRFFKVSLAFFLSTYVLRCVILLLIIFLWETYESWFENYPISAATAQAICHLTFDSVPVIHIMLHHRRIFKDEEKETTKELMRSSKEVLMRISK